MPRRLGPRRTGAGSWMAGVYAFLILVSATNSADAAQDVPPSDSGADRGADSGAAIAPRFWRAAAGGTAANVAVWAWNRYKTDYPWARVGVRSWRDNLRAGFTWDDNKLSMNEIWHPVHGSFYFSAARANGYSFWSSALFTLGGSLAWEFFGETIQPSANDVVSTTLGGISFGEVTYQLASRAVAGGDGRGRVPRAVAAFLVSPATMVQRWAGARPAGPGGSERWPALARGQFLIGYASPVERVRAPSVRGLPFVAVEVEQGDPFGDTFAAPYDVFDFAFEAGLTGDDRFVSRAEIGGLLTRSSVLRSARDHLVLGLVQQYSYVDVSSFAFGSQGIGATLRYQRRIAAGLEWRLGADVDASALGGTSAEYQSMRDRTSDFGPGFDGALVGSLRHGGRELLRIEHRRAWIHGVTGTPVDHLVSRSSVRLALPLGQIAIGGELSGIERTSRYVGLGDVRRYASQLRLYIAGPGP